MSLTFAIRRAFEKKARNDNWNKWPHLFVAVDLHDVIITGTYHKFNEGATFFPNAIKALKLMSDDPRFCLILYSSSYNEVAQVFMDRVKDEHGIIFKYFNENPECPSNDICDFSSKFYFDLFFDDKAGFEADHDWAEVIFAIKTYGSSL